MSKPNRNELIRPWLNLFLLLCAVLPACSTALGAGIFLYPDSITFKIKARTEKMLAVTKPGYYASLYLKNVKSRSVSNTREAAVADCSTSLCSSGALPVVLVDFTGKRVDSRQIQLEWTTTSEVNNDFFEIERTLNPAEGFQTVGTVKGHVNSTKNLSYQFTDPNKENAYTYYRLKQVDMDGSFEYSRIIAIKGFNQELMVNAFPNPGSGKDLAFIVAGGDIQKSISVQIFDQRGRSVYQNSNYLLPDNQQILLPGIAAQAGSYYIKIRTKQQQAGSSFIIVK